MNLTPPQKQAVVDQWFATNQPLITAAVLDALERVEGITEMLTDPNAKGEVLLREDIAACATTARGTLPEWMGEEFEKKFAASSTPGLLATLKAQSENICRDPAQMQIYIDELIARARARQPHR